MQEKLFQQRLQIPAGIGALTGGYFFRRAGYYQLSTAVAALRAKVDDVVGHLDHIQIVLDYHDRVAGVHQPLQHLNQPLHIRSVQAGGRFVQNIYCAAGGLTGELGGQLDALCFAAGKGGGRLPDLDIAEADIAMVGTRRASAYGLLQAKRLGYELGRYGAIVVSGGAAGIDTLALRGAVSSGTPPVAVFACGVDVDYPAANRSLFEDLRTNGCVMSELPPGTPPLPEHFPSRNRILSGLALGSVVVEAPKKSGALITARHALEQGRDVFTLPGNLGNPTCAGNIQLLKQGAILVEEGWDILQEYTYLYPELPQRQRPAGPMTLTAQEAAGSVVVAETAAAPEKTDTKAVDKQENRAYIDVQEILPQVSPDEAAVLRLLEDGKQPVDRLIDETQLPAGRILSALTLLEVKGYVKRLPARYYELAKK